MLMNEYKKEERHDRPVVDTGWTGMILPLLIVLSAWSLLIIASSEQWLSLFNHDALLSTPGLGWSNALVRFLPAWLIMVAATMLPALLPLLFALAEHSYGCSQQWKRQGTFIVGYTVVWMGFGVVIFLGDVLLHWCIAQWQWLYLHAWILPVVLLCSAGLLQWSPLKQRTLQRCSLSSNCLHDHISSTYHGLTYGFTCLGSCWALMLVFFAISMTSLPSMALGASIILLEKSVPPKYYLSRIIGLLLLLLAFIRLIF